MYSLTGLVVKKKILILSKMTQTFLAIPATSAALKRVFSKGRQILSWQRSSLKPKAVEQLLCLKEWYQSKDLSCLN
jgi:hypothetical protein